MKINLKKLWRKYKLILLLVFILVMVFYMVYILHLTLTFNQSHNNPMINLQSIRNINNAISSVDKTQPQIIQQVILQTPIINKKDNILEPPSRIVTIEVKEEEGLDRNVLGVANHPILSLNQNEFRSTPLNEQMSWYGQSKGGGSCNIDFGNELIDRWRRQKQSYCTAKVIKATTTSTMAQSSNLNSSIDCYLVQQTRHHGGGDQLCHMHNVAVALSLFNEDIITKPVVQEYVKSRHFKQPYIKFPKGFIYGDCLLHSESWKPIYMPGWNLDLTIGAFENNPTKLLYPITSSTNSNSKDSNSNKKYSNSADSNKGISMCEEWIDHPVLFQQRDTFANFFHDSEDFFNVFIAMAILKWKPGDTQLFLTDLYPKGPFWDIWSKVFSQRPHHTNNKSSSSSSSSTDITNTMALTAWDLKLKYKNKNKYICFKDLAIGIYGPAAPMTVNSWNTPCKRTALVRAYSDYVIRGLGLQHYSHYSNIKPNHTIVITYMSRRPSKEWPERKYCDSENSFFLCHLWEKFGMRKLGRMISNDKEVVQELKKFEQMVPELLTTNIGRTMNKIQNIIVQDVDYNILSFEEQIKIDLLTDIMIGPHGAGLMHNIFMRDRAQLIELFVDGSSANRHFHNLANWYGRSYKGIPIGNPISINQLIPIVKDAILSINLDTF